MDEETARREAASQIAIQAYVEQEAPVEEPSEEELRAYYDELVAQQEGAGGGEDDAASTAAPEIPEFDQVRDQLSQQLQSEEQAAATDELIAGLREDAEITSHL